jgi:hypothetical protein
VYSAGADPYAQDELHTCERVWAIEGDTLARVTVHVGVDAIHRHLGTAHLISQDCPATYGGMEAALQRLIDGQNNTVVSIEAVREGFTRYQEHAQTRPI